MSYTKRGKTSPAYQVRVFARGKEHRWLASDSSKISPAWNYFEWGPFGYAEYTKRLANNNTYNKRTI